jgi:hypothetical protein
MSSLKNLTLFTLFCAVGCQTDTGFRPLFNGNDLSGWQYIKPEVAKFDGMNHSTDKRYSAKDGHFVVNPGKGLSQIWTTEEFGANFILKLEFKAAVNADSGIFIKGIKSQLQCRDYWVAGPYKDLKSYKPQEWNKIVIVVKDNVATCTCNGVPLKFTRQLPPTGPIGLEADRGQMEYRNIMIKVVE